jgi:HPt (histidine-containing phosphotransfer) domain-containing protein
MLDRANILHRFNHEIVDMFLETYPDRMQEIRQAISNQNADALAQSAHTLKGLVAIFTLKDAYNAALRLEKMGVQKDLMEIESAWSELESEIETLKPLIASLKTEF